MYNHTNWSDRESTENTLRPDHDSELHKWFISNKRKKINKSASLLAIPGHSYLCQRICVHLCFLFGSEQYLRFLLIDVSETERQFKETTKNVPGADPGSFQVFLNITTKGTFESICLFSTELQWITKCNYDLPLAVFERTIRQFL